MRLILFLLSAFTFSLYGQEKIAQLPEVLHESSALVKFKNIFISLNDSGNENALYVFNEKGDMLNTCTIENTQNVDWEALSFDGDSTLYIGDIGNNNNIRKDQRIYIVSIHEVISKRSTKADIISFNYPDQKEFPPQEDALYYDAETSIIRNDSLFVLTKNRTVPFDGVIKVYGLSIKSGEQTPKVYPKIQLDSTSWMEDSATDGELFGNLLFLNTYSKVYVFKWKNGHFEQQDKIYPFDYFTQKEGIAVDENYIYISEENEDGSAEGAFLYRIER